MKIMEKKNESLAKTLGTLVGKICVWLISAGFIMCGWSVIAPHLNAPLFTYWEVFAIRMGLSCLMKIILQKE